GAGLGRVPGRLVAAAAHDGGAMAGEVVPGDHQGLGEQGEGDGALDGTGGAGAGLTGAGDGFGGAGGDFGGPPAGGGGGDLGGRGGHAGGDQGQAGLAGLGRDDHADRDRPVSPRPQAPVLADGHRGRFPVPGHGHLAAGGGGGQLGRGADLRAAAPG